MDKQRWHKWAQTASRITGLRIPIFDPSRLPPIPEKIAAERAITDFESRGLLYADFQWEVPKSCYDEAFNLRKELTEQMKELSHETPIFRQLDAIRDACRVFRNELRQRGIEKVTDHQDLRYPQKAEYFKILGALRDRIGIQIMILSVEYGVDVADHLAASLPSADSTENGEVNE